MKKNLWNGGLFPRKLPRKPIVMKTLLALFLFMNVSVVSTYAQQQKKNGYFSGQNAIDRCPCANPPNEWFRFRIR